MPSPLGNKPPFDVPLDLGPFGRKRLQGTNFLQFFELNKQDFFAVVAIFYLDIITDPDPGAVLDRRKGFNSFCDLLTQFFLGAPSQRLILTVDEKTGHYVNFFGEGILDHLGDLKGTKKDTSSQAMYADDGTENHTLVWQAVKTFVEYVAVQYFRTDSLLEVDIEVAQACIQQLRDRSRALRYVPGTDRRLYS